MLGITWKQKVRNTVVKGRIKEVLGNYEVFLGTAKRRKLQWSEHISRSPGTLMHNVMTGMVDGGR